MATIRKFITGADIRNGVWNAIDRLIGFVTNPEAGRTVTGASTLVSSDIGKTLRVNSASSVTLTIPTDATAGWTNDTIVSAYQVGAGSISFAAASGVTLRSPSGIPSSVQYGIVSALRVGPNEWTLV